MAGPKPVLRARDATTEHVLVYPAGQVRRILAVRECVRPRPGELVELLICGVGFRWYPADRALGLMKVRLVD